MPYASSVPAMVMVVVVMMMSDHKGCSGAAALGQTLIVGLRSSTPTLSNIPSCLALWWLSGVY